MKRRVQELWENNPLKLIMWLAIITRLIAAIFSKGYGMHDDHFLVIEAAQSWLDGRDYDNWLPSSQTEETDRAHNYFYVGINYILLWFMELFGVFNPQTKMFIMRLLHGAFSLGIVYFAYKIVHKISDCKSAKMVGLILAVLWIMPFVSVRNLVEIFCIPFMMYGLWLIVKHWESNKALTYFFFAGFIIGIAFSIRYQTMLFGFGIGLALLFKSRWKEAIIFGIGYLSMVVIIQGGIDLFMWGEPFKALKWYVFYNVTTATNYFDAPWYNYILLILGVMIPPVSIFISIGFFKNWKRYLLIFLPTLIFFAFHSYYPNKQERFILPVLPFIIMLGIMGWNEFVLNSSFWAKRRKLLHACWTFFWVINLIMLPVITTAYSKRARVESMTYLSKYENIDYLLLNSKKAYSMVMGPRFYLKQWPVEYCITADQPFEVLPAYTYEKTNRLPGFILFFEDKALDDRVAFVKQYWPNIEYETKIEPGFIDKTLHWLNPLNSNPNIYIYRNKDIFPQKAE